MGVAAGQQLDVEVGGDRAHLLRRDAQRDTVHAVAPRPEVVVRRVAAFGEAGEGALEGVAVRIDQAGKHGPGDRLGVVGAATSGTTSAQQPSAPVTTSTRSRQRPPSQARGAQNRWLMAAIRSAFDQRAEHRQHGGGGVSS